jgi:hypothetical protein
MLNSKCHFIEEKQENIKKFVQPVQRFLIIEVCDARMLNRYPTAGLQKITISESRC